MNNKHLRELRKFLKQYKATPISPEYQKQADVITGLIPALVDTITDVELDHMMTLFADYLMTSIISPQKELDVLDDQNSRQPAEDGLGHGAQDEQPSLGGGDNGDAEALRPKGYDIWTGDVRLPPKQTT